MSERMTDSSIAYDWRLVQNKTDATEQTSMAQTRLEEELKRARASEGQKNAVITALADALCEYVIHPTDCSAWLANGDFDEAMCSCGIAAALRLAGRL